jgi:predicted RNA-binding protein YlqC (UPF0109 family)
VDYNESRQKFRALAQYVAQSMVADEDRDKIEVKTRIDRGELEVLLKVPDNYRGLFIGRSGHMVRSLRHLIAAANIEAPTTVSLDID